MRGSPFQWISDNVPFGAGIIEFIPISFLATALFSLCSFLVSGFISNPVANTAPAPQTPLSQWQQQGSPAVTNSRYLPPPSPGKGGYVKPQPQPASAGQTNQTSTPNAGAAPAAQTTQQLRPKPTSRLDAEPVGEAPVLSLDDLNSIEITTESETERGGL